MDERELGIEGEEVLGVEREEEEEVEEEAEEEEEEDELGRRGEGVGCVECKGVECSALQAGCDGCKGEVGGVGVGVGVCVGVDCSTLQAGCVGCIGGVEDVGEGVCVGVECSTFRRDASDAKWWGKGEGESSIAHNE